VRSDRPPAWLVASKVALAIMLLVGALAPSVGGFEGKGMAYRLPIFLAPSLIVPIGWLRRRGGYRVALDAGLTLPFLFDTAGNAFGFYDSIDRTDDVLHFVNWFVLFGGVTATLAVGAAAGAPRWLIGVVGTGLGAIGIIGWEVAEYGVMQWGVAGLSLTYGDTLADLVLSTAGAGAGAALVLRILAPDPPIATTGSPG
jgi:hypothetical protein